MCTIVQGVPQKNCMIRNSEKTNIHYLKNYRAQNKLYNILGIFLPVQECVCVCVFRISNHAVLLGRPVVKLIKQIIT